MNPKQKDGANSETDTSQESLVDPQLIGLRQSIDNIDSVLVHTLAERFKLTAAVGHLKVSLGMPASDPAREQRQTARLRALAVEAQLDPAFAENFLSTIVTEVVHNHQLIAIEEASSAADVS